MGEELKASVNVRELIADLAKVNKQLLELQKTGRTTISDFEKIDVKTGKVTRTLVELTRAGDLVTTTMQKMNGVWDTLTVRTKANEKAVDGLTQKLIEQSRVRSKLAKESEKDILLQEKARAAAQAAAIQQNLPRQLAAGTTLADPEIRRFGDPRALAQAEAALGGLTRALKGNEKEVIATLTAYNNLNRDGLAAFNRLSPQVQAALRKFETATNRLKTPLQAAKDRLAQLKNEVNRFRETETIASKLAAQFNKLSISTDPTKIRQFNSALISLRQTMLATGTSSAQAGEAWRKLNAGGAQIFDQAQSRIIPALQRVQAAMRQTANESEKASKSMVISWSSVARIVVGGAIHRTFFALTSAMRDSIDTAKEFSVAIAEIQTISTDTSITTKQWADEVFRLSEQFGKTAQDVAEGVYQTLSNQVAQGADAILFMEEALKLSLATVSTAEESVNALTSAINAFGLDVREAGRVADQYFKIVELGRVRLGELSNSFGRVLVLANQLGVTFAETGAFIDLATIRGVKANEAMTQLRNVFLKLLRPTDALKEKLREFGIESGEQLVQVGGFVGVMEFLSDVIRTEGVPALAEYFGRVRAITGALQAGEGGLERFKEDFDKLENSIENATEAADKVRESLGTRFQRIIQAASNFFTKEFGEKFIRTIVYVVEGIGGMERILRRFFSLLTSGAFGIAISLIQGWRLQVQKARNDMLALDAATQKANASQKTLWSTTRVLVLAVLVAELAQYLFQMWEDSSEAAIEHDKKIRELTKKQFEEVRKQQAKILDTVRKNAAKVSREWFKAIAEVRKDLFKLQDELELRNEELKDEISGSIRELSRFARDALKEPADALRRLTSQVETAQRNLATTRQKIEASVFQESLKDAKDINVEVDRIADRIDLLQKRAADALGLGDFKSSQRDFAEAQKLLTLLANKTRKFDEESREARENLSDLEAKSADISLRLRKKRLDLDKKIAREGDPLTKRLLKRQLQQEIESSAREQEELNEKILRSRDLIDQSKRLTLTTSEILKQRLNLLKDQAFLEEEAIARQKFIRDEQKKQLEERKAKTEELFRAIEQVQKSESIVNREVKAGVKPQKQILDEAKKRTTDAIKLADELLKGDVRYFDLRLKLAKQFEEQNEIVARQFRARAIEEQLKLDELAAKEIRENIVKEYQRAQEEVKKLTDLQEELVNKIRLFPDKLVLARDVFEQIYNAGGVFSDALLASLQSLGGLPFQDITLEALEKKIIAATARTGEAGRKDLLKLREELTRYVSEFQKGITLAGLTEQQIRDQNRPLLASLDIARRAAENIDELLKARDAYTTEQENLTKAAKAMDALNTSTKNLAGIWNEIAADVEFWREGVKELAEIVKRLRAPRTGAVVAEPNARGGFIDFRRRGTDTVPAMLTPGEFVVNRRATQANLPILKAINSGIRPQRFQSGGQVGNQTINVGDINISNTGGQPVTEDTVTRALRRAYFKGKTKVKI